MPYLATPADSPLYADEIQRHGYIPQYAMVFALAPDVYRAWEALGAAVRAGMDERRYELATVAAAQALRARYCLLAHADVLRRRHFDADKVRRILTDHHDAGLTAAEMAIMDFAARIAADPGAATAADMDGLREAGLSDRDIFQIILAVCARRFFAGAIDAVGAEPDSSLESVATLLPV